MGTIVPGTPPPPLLTEDPVDTDAIALQLGDDELAAAFGDDPAAETLVGGVTLPDDPALPQEPVSGRFPRDADASLPQSAAPAATASSAPAAADGSGPAARLRGLLEQRRIAMTALGVAGVLVGALGAAAVSWQVLSARSAQVAAQDARIAAQSAQLLEQAAELDRLTRAAQAPPPAPPEIDAPTAAPAGATAADAGPPPSVPAPLLPAPAAPAPLPESVLPPRAAPASSPGAASPAASGICDLRHGPLATEALRKCLDWFSREGSPPPRPPD